jgi:hypothetical protein
MRSEIEIHAGDKKIELENISNDLAIKAINIIRENMLAHKVAQRFIIQHVPVESPQPPVEGPVQKLKHLKDMLDAGLISQEEYNSKKGDILSRM